MRRVTPEMRRWMLRKVCLRSAVERYTPVQALPEAKDDELFLYGPIVDGETATFLQMFDCPAVTSVDVINRLGEIEGDITVRLNSPGGDVYEGSAIHSALLQRAMAGDTITVRVDGVAASAASFIACVGKQVQIAPMGAMMIHAAMALVFGRASDMRAAGDLLDRTTKQAAAIYAVRLGKTEHEVFELLNGEADVWYMGPEAVEAGLADAVMAAEPDMGAGGDDGGEGDMGGGDDAAKMAEAAAGRRRMRRSAMVL